MTWEEIVAKMEEIFPGCAVDVRADGLVKVDTGFQYCRDGRFRPHAEAIAFEAAYPVVKDGEFV